MCAAPQPTSRSQEERILWLLQSSWPAWTPAPALSHISLQYSARIFSLRKKGWQIANRVEVHDGVKHGYFRLGESPNPPKLAPVKPSPHIGKDQYAGSLFGDLSPETPRHRDDG